MEMQKYDWFIYAQVWARKIALHLLLNISHLFKKCLVKLPSSVNTAFLQAILG